MMRFGSILAASWFGLSGCDASAQTEQERRVYEAPPIAQTMSELDQRILEYGNFLPSCESTYDRAVHNTCSLVLENRAVLIFETAQNEARDDWGGPADRVTIAVISMNGDTIQSLEETVSDTFAHPRLQDIGGDAELELLIPVYTGNVNTHWRVWQQIGNTFSFAGEVNGFDVAYDSKVGFTAVNSRDSAATYLVDYLDLTNQGLEHVYSVASYLNHNSCSVWPGPAFSSSGLDLEALLAECSAAMQESEQ